MLGIAESNQPQSSLVCKDADIVEGEGECKDLKKTAKSRSRSSKLEYSPDGGADPDGDQYGQGTSSSCEEKVSSLRTEDAQECHAHFILGLMYQRMGQPQKAVSAYEKAEKILLGSDDEIDRPELLSLVQIQHAQCLLVGSLAESNSESELETKELKDILVKLSESMKSDGRQASVYKTLGLILLKSSAISVLSTLLTFQPDNLDCLGNLGIAYLQSGNLELTAKCFQDLLLRDQNHPAALINYAAVLLCKHGSVVAGAGANIGEGGSDEQVEAANVAKECFIAAVKMDPKSAHVWANLASAYTMIGDHQSSEKCLEKAAKLEPSCLATRYAVALHRIRDAERSQNPAEPLSMALMEMISILKENSSLVDPSIAWSGLASVHKTRHEIALGFDMDLNKLAEVEEQAVYSLKQAIGVDPDYAIQWHQLCLHSLRTQQFQMSQKYLKAAVARMKDNSCAWSNLGISLQLSDQTSQAEEVYKRALSLAPEKQAHTIFCNLGNLFRQQKRYETAKAMFTKCLKLQPGYAPAYNNLGLVFVAEGLWEEAKYCFKTCFEADPLLDAAQSNLIKAEAASRMVSSSPSSPKD